MYQSLVHDDKLYILNNKSSKMVYVNTDDLSVQLVELKLSQSLFDTQEYFETICDALLPNCNTEFFGDKTFIAFDDHKENCSCNVYIDGKLQLSYNFCIKNASDFQMTLLINGLRLTITDYASCIYNNSYMNSLEFDTTMSDLIERIHTLIE